MYTYIIWSFNGPKFTEQVKLEEILQFEVRRKSRITRLLLNFEIKLSQKRDIQRNFVILDSRLIFACIVE